MDMKLDIEFVRSCFPAFTQVELKDWAFFENAGGSYACGAAIEALHNYYLNSKLQPYHAYPASQQAGTQMDRAKDRMAAMLNVASDEVNFGPSTSQNTFNLAQSLAEYLAPGDEIVVTNQDHEANIGVWRRLEHRGLVIKEWQVDTQTGELVIDDLANLLSDKTKVVAFTHASNIVASINPVKEIVALAHTAGAIAIVDGVSYCGHGLPDISTLGADVYLFSLYKVYGPHLGVMVLGKALNQLPYQGHFFNQDKAGYRFTPAGPDHAQIAAVNGVIDYFEAIYQHHFTDQPDSSAQAKQVLQLFQAHEHETVQPLLDYLANHSQIRLLGKSDASQRAPTVAFTSQKHTPLDLVKRLAQEQLMTGSGHFYSYRLLQALGIDPEAGVCRASMVHYNSAQDVQRLIEALDKYHPA